MKHLVLAAFIIFPTLAAPAQTAHPRTQHKTTRRATPKVYVCGGGSSYAYHSSDNCAGLNRCSHGVSPVTVSEAENMGRRPCKKCH